ncbi:MAG: hypothetical protein ACYDDU_09860 [Dermatophilaceae bacterium]
MTAVHADSLEGVSPAAAVGVAGVRDQFPGHTVTVTADDNGGVFVVVDDVPAGSPYREATTWLGFHINAAYPDSDVYPHFVGPLTRMDEQAHAEGFSATQWRDRPALQLSRRSNRWSAATDTAALKAVKILTWLASR